MATFFGGEQLVEKGYVVSTFNDADIGEVFLLYTVPAGHYLILDFAWAGSAFNYPLFYYSVLNADSYILSCVPSDFQIGFFTELIDEGNLKGTDKSYISLLTGSRFGQVIDEGFNFYARSKISNTTLRAEIRFRLYKKP